MPVYHLPWVVKWTTQRPSSVCPLNTTLLGSSASPFASPLTKAASSHHSDEYLSLRGPRNAPTIQEAVRWKFTPMGWDAMPQTWYTGLTNSHNREAWYTLTNGIGREAYHRWHKSHTKREKTLPPGERDSVQLEARVGTGGGGEAHAPAPSTSTLPPTEVFPLWRVGLRGNVINTIP